MIYVYPRLPGIDMGLFRLGGPGLGNLLMIYGRAVVFAYENKYKLIWPTWPSIKIGPYIRKERDKRFYGDLFINNNKDISGTNKLFKLTFLKRVEEDELNTITDNCVVVFNRYISTITEAGLIGKSEIIKKNLELNKASQHGVKINLSKMIAIHVRLGDFKRADESKVIIHEENSSSPIQWYVKVIKSIRKIVSSTIPVRVFSDGTDEELQAILELEETERVHTENALNDILTMSSAPLLIASGSTFSVWARFLGNMSAIAYPGQLREKILTDNFGFEIEYDGIEPLNEKICEKIREIYKT